MAEAKKTVTSKQLTADSKPEKKLPTEGSKLATATKKSVAKSGKRSAKAIAESEEKQAKEARKKSTEDVAHKPKVAIKPPRAKLERRGKKFRAAAKQIDKDKKYSLKEAVGLALKTSPVKFDATVELHANLNVDPKLADQNVRGTVALPAGSGKTIKVAVFTDESADKLKKAGADIVGSADLLSQLEKEQIKFDLLITSPQMMQQLAKYARILGPKGLMPNPKSGTVANDLENAVKEAKAGRVEYRVDSEGIIHLAIGKVSFGEDKLNQNAEAIVKSIKAAKPASVKGPYIQSLYLTTSMGPSIKVEIR